jgi:hypothetical protein
VNSDRYENSAFEVSQQRYKKTELVVGE